MAGGTERPNELFEEEFHKESTRLAVAKKSSAFGGDRAAAAASVAAAANSNSRPGLNGAAAPAARGEGASSAPAAPP